MKMTLQLILKPEVRLSGRIAFGGTEHVFFEDCSFLKMKGFIVWSFARGKRKGIKSLYYPEKIVVFSHFLFKKNYFNHFFKTANFFLLFFFEAAYTLHFYIISKKNDSVILSYSNFLISLFQKSIVIVGNEHHHFNFSTMFGQKYGNSIYLFCSKYLQRKYMEKYPNILNKKNSFVLHNAIDSRKFFPIKISSLNKEKRIILLFAGAWVLEKGLLILLKALNKMKNIDLSRYVLMITSSKNQWYSDFPEMNKQYLARVKQLLKLLKKRGLEIRQYNGVRREQMIYYYNRADYTIFPSLWNEPFGLVVLESLACGTPVLAFDSGALKEIVDASNAILLKEKTVNILFSSLLGLKKNQLKKQSLLTEKNDNMLIDRRIKVLEKYIRLVAK